MFCGADDSVITLQSAAGDNKLNAVKLIDINLPNINKKMTGSPCTLAYVSNWENLPSDYIDHWYRNLIVLYDFKITVNFDYSMSNTSMWFAIDGGGWSEDVEHSKQYTGGKTAYGSATVRKMLALKYLAIGDTNSTYRYSSYYGGPEISLQNTMSYGVGLSFNIQANVSYTCTGHFNYTVYGIL